MAREYIIKYNRFYAVIADNGIRVYDVQNDSENTSGRARPCNLCVANKRRQRPGGDGGTHSSCSRGACARIVGETAVAATAASFPQPNDRRRWKL